MGKDKKKPSKNTSATKTSTSIYYLIFSLLILLLYGQSISFEFTLDDDTFIANYPVVKKGVSGIGSVFSQGSMEHFRGSNFQIYRPAFLSFLCIEYGLFELQPGGYHLVNILLYILCSIVLFRLMKQLLPRVHTHFTAAMVILFIAHPVHTEVVASVKSQDELFSALFNLLALLFFHRSVAGDKIDHSLLVKATLSYVVALFCKESSFAFVAIFPLIILFTGFTTYRKVLTGYLPLVAAALLFLGVRQLVIGDYPQDFETTEIENILYGATTPMEISATKAEILGYFLRVMFYPHPLSWDYSFNQIPIADWTAITPWISVAAYLVLGLIVLFSYRRQPAVAFGLLFFLILITPTSSLFFLNGTTFAERFLFLPSAGFLTAAVMGICTVSGFDTGSSPGKQRKTFYSITGLLVVVYCGMTFSRTADWKDNLAVFTSGARNSPNSSRTNAGLGSLYMTMAEQEQNFQIRNAYMDSAIIYLEKSIAIFPENSNARYRLGLIYAIRGDTATALMQYRQSIYHRPNVLALNNLGSLYASMNQTDSAYTCFRQSLDLEPANEMTLTNLCIVSNLLNRTDEAISTGEKAISLNMGNKKIYMVMANAYEKKGNPERTSYYLQLSNTASR